MGFASHEDGTCDGSRDRDGVGLQHKLNLQVSAWPQDAGCYYHDEIRQGPSV